MCFSPPKCEFLRITNVIHFQYLIQSIEVHEVQQAKYLVKVDRSYSNHIEQSKLSTWIPVMKF